MRAWGGIEYREDVSVVMDVVGYFWCTILSLKAFLRLLFFLRQILLRTGCFEGLSSTLLSRIYKLKLRRNGTVSSRYVFGVVWCIGRPDLLCDLSFLLFCFAYLAFFPFIS